MQCHRAFSAQFAYRALVLFLANIVTVSASDLLIFPSITGTARNTNEALYPRQEVQPALDIFFSIKRESFLFLAEYFVNRHERELERFQLGISPNSSNTIWLGRFHTPISYWNTTYHHGAYLQASIVRPGIADYEDEQGILPMHTTGLLWDGTQEFGQTRWNYKVAIGFGPILDDTLMPLNLLSPGERGRLSISAKLGFQPLSNETDETGVFGGYTEIPYASGPYTQAKQIVAGGFYNKIWNQWHFISELTLIHTRLESALKTSSSYFANAYVHAEYQFSGKLAGYGRIEASSNTENAYLQMFPGFISSRTLIGARWEPAPKQAIKLELMRNERQDNYRYNELDIQWSMVFP